jgi:hypothetical protein
LPRNNILKAFGFGVFEHYNVKLHRKGNGLIFSAPSSLASRHLTVGGSAQSHFRDLGGMNLLGTH